MVGKEPCAGPILMDIELSDGQKVLKYSNLVEVKSPVISTMRLRRICIESI